MVSKVDASAGKKSSKKDELKPGERQPQFKDFIRVFSYAKRVDWFLIFAACISSIGSGITLPLMNVIFGKLVGNFSVFGDGSSASEFRKVLNRQALYIFILFLARFTLNYINKFAFRMISARMSAAIRLDYLRCLFQQSIHVLDSMPSGSAANTITTTANTLQLGISENLGTFIEFMSCIIAAVIISFTYSWLLTLVISSILFYIVIVSSIVLPFLIKGESEMSKAETMANSVAAEAFGNIRMLMACDAESKMARKYNKWVLEAKKKGQGMTPYLGTMFGNVFFSLFAGFALAFWYGFRLFHQGRISTVGTVIVVVMSVMTVVMSIERVATPLIAASKAMVAASEFFVVIDAPRPDTGQLRDPDVSATEDIVFSNVDFAYPGRPHVKVLDNLNIHIAAGKVNAIVGPSGSGKSTIVGLVERWYSLSNEQHRMEKVIVTDSKAEAAKKEQEKQEKKEAKKRLKAAKKSAKDTSNKKNDGPPPLSVLPGDEKNVTEDLPRIELKGSVTTCNTDLNAINVKWWRSQIGLVQQEPFLFNDTIHNNVAFGLTGSPYEDAPEDEKTKLVEDACREAFADEFINRLPDRYQTRVGESGAKLSGGQRQRIAIARSIVKKPKILILDEATSAIDVRSERIVQAALDKVSRNRTTITVAHRLSTIRSADQIIVMQKGRCVEVGTHESLLENSGGVYYGLVNAQQLSRGDDNGNESAPSNAEISDMDVPVEPAHELVLAPGVAFSKTLSTESDGNVHAVAGTEKQAVVWKNKGFFGSFGRLIYEQKANFPYLAGLVILGAGTSVSWPLQAWLFSKLVVLFGLLTAPAIDLPKDTLDQVTKDGNFYSLMFFVMAIGVGVAYFGVGIVAAIVEHAVCAAYREDYFLSIVQQRVAFFDDENNSTGTLTNRVSGDPKQLRQLLGSNMTLALGSIFTIIGSLIVSFVFGWKLALLAFAVIVPLVLVSGFYRTRYEIQFDAMNAAVFAESSKWAAESIDAFRTVTALTLEDVICKRYEVLLATHVHEAYKKARFTTFIFAISNSISLACQALIFWYGGRLVASGEYTSASFFVCYMASIQGAESAGQGLSFMPNVAQVTAAANRILSIRTTRNFDAVSLEERIPDMDADADTRIGNSGASIELRNVHFRYPTRDVPIFRGLNLTIERGKFTAIVGASGSGKSSIVALLERFYDAEKGSILCNGRDITEVNVRTYRKLLSLVAQEPALFQGTVRENVMLGVDDSTVTEADMIQACRDASIHDFVSSLPEGYDTDLGSRAVSLSGGQKQRVAIARALLRNPRVLLLDEATASLDSDTEKMIQATFERVSQGRTTLAVAHRLSTIQKADTIYVLGDGEVLEKGNHADLLKQQGVYYSMCQSQALDN